MTNLLTVNEAAELLKMNPSTIYRATKTGTLPHVRIGRSIRIPEDQLENLINTPVQERTAPPKTVTHAPVTRL